MKVFILSNDDLSSNLIFAPLIAQGEVEVVGLAYTATVTPGKQGQLSGVLGLLRRMDWRYWLYLVYVNGCFRLFERLTAWLRSEPRFGWLASLRRYCALSSVPVYVVRDFNAPEFHDILQRSGAELLVIRVNQILSATTLSIPRRGVWCVHSSLLPSYRGIAGEFHALRNNEPRIGTTIFRVEPELDKGPPLFQTMLETTARDSVFAHMVRNNLAAGKFLAMAVGQLARIGRVEPSLVGGMIAPSYFSWPKRRQVRQLRDRGGRIIRLREVCGFLTACLRLKRLRHADRRTVAPAEVKHVA